MAILNKINRLVSKAALLLVLAAILIQPTLAQTTIDLAVHYVTGTPNTGQFTYDVAAYFSLLDTSGNPIKDLTVDNLTLTEDGQQVTIDSLEPATDEPIYVALVLDTSGSMAGPKIAAARKAASSFISSLTEDDRVAVLSFNKTTTIHIDFTTDHAAATQQVSLIDAVSGTRTCLYDAAYEAVQLTGALPPGRRAIIVLTDGIDVLASGGTCSTYTADDVIDLASRGSMRVPIYTVGLGSEVDAKTLERMSGLTGGRYQYSPDSAQLEALFLRLSDQLRSQYVIHYTSTAAPGSHTVVLKANYLNAQDQDSRDFTLPPHPYSLTFTAPGEGDEISQMVTLTIAISGQGEPIKQVTFFANDVSIGSDTTTPYELEWDASSVEAGETALKAVAYGENDEELASTSINVTIVPVVLETPTALPEEKEPISTLLLGGLIGAVVLVAVIIIVIMMLSKRRKDAEREREWQEKVVNPPDLPTVGMDDRTMDAFEPSPDALGVLVILQSDDTAMQNERYEITKTVTKLGRKSDNDIIFARDSSVSRNHAIIEDQGGQLILNEVISFDDEGKSKPPTYGTFLNDNQLASSTALKNGDEIRLGRRVRIRFEGVTRPAYGDDVTIDEFEASDESTRDDLTSGDGESTQDLGIKH